MLKVRDSVCETCIYKRFGKEHIAELEQQVADPNMEGHFRGTRACHKHDYRPGDESTCCRGFYNRHRDNCTPLQVADRLGIVRFVE